MTITATVRRSARPRRLLAVASVAALVVVPGASAAFAGDQNPGENILICHATNADGNAYVINTPNKNGTVDGHASDSGPVWTPALKDLKIAWGDIIPPFDYNEDDQTEHFAGLNWDANGQAWYANSCVVPITAAVDKTNDANADAAFTDDETTTVPGTAVTFKVTVTNTSVVPAVVTGLVDRVSGNPVAFTPSPNPVGTTLAAGAATTFTFSLAGYSPADGASIINTLTATLADADDPENTGTASDTSTVRTVEPVITVLVDKTNDANADAAFTDDETTTAPGADVTFKVTVTNSSAVSAVVTGLVDSVSGTPVTFTPSPNPVGTTLAAGAATTFTFTVTGYSPADGASVVNTLTATLAYVANPANVGSGSDTSTVRTVVAPDVAVVKTGTATAAPGDTLTWTLTASNSGTVAASGVTLTDVLPASTTLVSATGTGWTCTGTTTLVCTYDTDLAVGASSAVTVVATLDAAFTGTSVSNTVVVTPADVTPADNTSTFVTDVTQPAGGGGGVVTPPEQPITGGGGGVTLPRTGSPLGWLTAGGLALLLSGLGLVLLSPVRRQS
jgi:uncharacterized repeat protein (TIGR01451 family)